MSVKILTLLFAVLSNKHIVDAFGKWLESLVPDPVNAVDKEYVEGQKSSMGERVVDNRVPADGNVFLEQDKINQLKKHHRKGPPK